MPAGATQHDDLVLPFRTLRSGITGRLVRPFTTRFCVQWPEQQRINPGSVLVGPLY